MANHMSKARSDWIRDYRFDEVYKSEKDWQDAFLKFCQALKDFDKL